MSVNPTLTTRLPVFWLSGNTFQNGQIETTNLDMTPEYSITNLHDPVNPQDAATKQYIDQSLLDTENAVHMQNFTLTGTDMTWIPLFPDRGSFICFITGKMANGPSAIYTLSKSKSGDGSSSTIPYESGNLQRINQSGAIGSQSTSFVRLIMTIDQVDSTSGDQKLMIAKVPDDMTNDVDAYDGQYEIVFLGSDGTV